MTEPDVALTDFGLALLCSWFSWKRPGNWRAFFASVALASVLGGAVHGFFLEETTWAYRILWPATLLAIGWTASLAWMIAGRLISPTEKQRTWIVLAAGSFLAQAITVLFFSQAFVVAIINYLPAMTALLFAALWSFRRTREKRLLAIAAGIVVGFLAAFVQRAGIGLDPVHFNHNATYHVLQAVGLALLFWGSGKDQHNHLPL